MNQIDIEKYIKDYEERKITLEEIAEKEHVNKRTIQRRIDKYFEVTGIEKPVIHAGPKKKVLNIEKYIEDYEQRTITIKEISEIECVSMSIVSKRLDEFYKEKGLERPIFLGARKRQIDIEKYIRDYEERKVTAQDISNMEKVDVTTIYSRIDEYYKSIGKERPEISTGARKKLIDIEQYIGDYEENIITLEEIAKKENVHETTIINRMNEYYRARGIGEIRRPLGRKPKEIDIQKYVRQFEDGNQSIDDIAAKAQMSSSNIYIRMKKYYEEKEGKEIANKITLKERKKKKPITKNTNEIIKVFLKRGLKKEAIREIAEKRKIFISDELFEQLSKEIEDEMIR